MLAQTENNRSIYLVDCTWANMSIVLTTKTIKLSNKETIKTRKEIQKNQEMFGSNKRSVKSFHLT